MDVEVTADRIRWLVQDRPIDQNMHTIMEAFKLHNEQMKQLVGIDFAEGTMERYQVSYDHTLRFLQQRYKVSDLWLLHPNNLILKYPAQSEIFSY